MTTHIEVCVFQGTNFFKEWKLKPGYNLSVGLLVTFLGNPGG